MRLVARAWSASSINRVGELTWTHPDAVCWRVPDDADDGVAGFNQAR